MPAESKASPPVIARLCPQCGLCCDGVLFKDVELQAGDNPKKLKELGLPVSKIGNRQSAIANHKFPQPCAALDGCLCCIYPDRPTRCRDFECALLKAVSAGEAEVDVALRTIRTARQRAEKVLRLLRELGDRDEHLALSLRFKRTKRRFESLRPDDAVAETFSRLTLAVHDLNLLLRDNFYG